MRLWAWFDRYFVVYPDGPRRLFCGAIAASTCAMMVLLMCAVSGMWIPALVSVICLWINVRTIRQLWDDVFHLELLAALRRFQETEYRTFVLEGDTLQDAPDPQQDLPGYLQYRKTLARTMEPFWRDLNDLRVTGWLATGYRLPR
jgi:hypothetical protein